MSDRPIRDRLTEEDTWTVPAVILVILAAYAALYLALSGMIV